jgi:hypothetical protein
MMPHEKAVPKLVLERKLIAACEQLSCLAARDIEPNS